MIENIFTEMQALIKKHGLELMQNYPNDLLVHDRQSLEQSAHVGASIAWVVGHSHTHLVNLGLHPDENQMVRHLTNLSSQDKFYVIRITAGEFKFFELDRAAFGALASSSIPYSKLGGIEDFVLLKNGRRVGKILVNRLGNYADRHYSLELSAVAGATKQDHLALRIWAEKAAVTISGTLFIKTTITITFEQVAVQSAPIRKLYEPA